MFGKSLQQQFGRLEGKLEVMQQQQQHLEQKVSNLSEQAVASTQHLERLRNENEELRKILNSLITSLRDEGVPIDLPPLLDRQHRQKDEDEDEEEVDEAPEES